MESMRRQIRRSVLSAVNCPFILHVPLPGVGSVRNGIQREIRSSFIIESSRVVAAPLRFESGRALRASRGFI